ncbi:MAG: hypothetical protein ACRDQ2_02975 [Gaiellales bacterium]
MRWTGVLAAVPGPVGWVIDQGANLVGGVAGWGFDKIVTGLTGWVMGAVLWVVGGVFHFFFDVTDPNVQADWFLKGTGPYATTVSIAAVLLVGFVLIGITQGVLAGDVGGLLRRVGIELPMAVLGMVGLVTVTQALITLTDALSNGLLGHFDRDVQAFTATVTGLSALEGGPASAFVVFLLGLITVVAGIVLVAELVVRSALVYIVVALAPLVLAAQVWPALKGAGRKMLELLVALIVSKLVIAIALAVAAAAAVGAGSGGEVTALARPEVVAESSGGSVGQAVGILLAASAAFGVAAFSPLLVTRLLPFTEAAVVASGIKGGPARAGQQAMSAGYYAQGTRARLNAVAAKPAGGSATGCGRATGPGGSPAGGGGGGGAGAGAAGGAASAAAVATRAVRKGASAATATTESASSSKGNGAATRRSPPPRPPRRPPTTGGGAGNGTRA